MFTFWSSIVNIWVREEVKERTFFCFMTDLHLFELWLIFEKFIHNRFGKCIHFYISNFRLKPNQNFCIIIETKGHLNIRHLFHLMEMILIELFHLGEFSFWVILGWTFDVVVHAFLHVDGCHPFQLINMHLYQMNIRRISTFLKYQNQSILRYFYGFSIFLRYSFIVYPIH